MSKSNKTTTTFIRYANYLESAHQSLISQTGTHVTAAIAANPYSSYVTWDVEDAFFGVGYVISDFPSLYDMFGKFMAGLDIESLFTQIYTDTVNGTEVSELISEEAARLSDDLEEEALPRFELGMSDMNSVMSSTFVNGRAMMEVGRTKALSKYSAEAKARMIPVAVERWKEHLGWNKEVINLYAQILKFYISQRLDVEDREYEMGAKSALWPFNALQYETQVLSVLSGATNTTSNIAGASTASKAIGGALSGAASGAMIGSVVPGIGTALGTGIGGLIGLAGGLFS